MSEVQNVVRSLNPCVFHLQKLKFELNCAACLNMLNKPILLPCNHIFCSSCVEFSIHCPTCQQRVTDQEIRPASYMENIIAIYKNLDASFKSAIQPLRSTDSEAPPPGFTSIGQLTKDLGEMAPKANNNCTDTVRRGIELAKCSVLEEVDINHAQEMSPGSSRSSFCTKDADQNSSPGCGNEGTDKNRVKSSFGDHLAIVADGVYSKDTFAREAKRQKKLSYGSPGAVLLRHTNSQTLVSVSGAAASKHEDCKSKEDASIISSTVHPDSSFVDRNVCAFCHSSNITEQTGQLLHYEGGKKVARGEAAFSKSIPVHSKCIEWTPQIYFNEDDMIMNLESELARASKLKCSSCGLKGAGLGCFVKSCRRSYHVPCAVEIPDCRWDCKDFLMLCPSHKSIKFPREKSNSRKPPSGEKCSLSSEITSEQSNTWANLPRRPQEWVLCGSALSNEEKCLVVNFAKTSGVTVYKFWNPSVTHVIAATDSNGSCSRTLKFLMAILKGKWVLSMDWVKACVEANRLVDEEPYEVNLDNHGFRDGPKTGRLRASENAPLLFEGLSFYFNGEFNPSYKIDLMDLVRVGGGAIVERMDQVVAEAHSLEDISTTLVVYNHDHPQGCATPKEASFVSLKRVAEAEDVAKRIDARVVPHTWVLESIAACHVLVASHAVCSICLTECSFDFWNTNI